MSAYVCSNDHISAIVNYPRDTARLYGNPYIYNDHSISISDPEELGQLLLEENVKSVNHRYHDKDSAKPEDYKFQLSPLNGKGSCSTIQFIKHIHCLKYQSCEHDGWEKSIALKILNRLEGWAVGHLPGYNDAEWGI